MLESVTGGEVRGRYSIIGMKPDLIWDCRRRRQPASTAQARFDRRRLRARWSGHPLDTLRALIAESRIDLPDDLPAGGGGALRLPRLRHDPAGRASAEREPRPAGPARRRAAAPLGRGGARRREGRGDRGLARLGQSTAFGARRLCPGGRAGDGRGARPRTRHAGRRAAIWARRCPTPSRCRTSRTTATRPRSRRPRTTSAPATSSRSCRRSAGRRTFRCRPSRFTARLRRTNPSPFMFYFNFGGFQVIGASPEILVRVVRRRGHDPPHRRHPPPRRHARRGQGARGRPAGRQEGTGRAPDAARPRPQRRRPRRQDRHRPPDREVHRRAL